MSLNEMCCSADYPVCTVDVSPILDVVNDICPTVTNPSTMVVYGLSWSIHSVCYDTMFLNGRDDWQRFIKCWHLDVRSGIILSTLLYIITSSVLNDNH